MSVQLKDRILASTPRNLFVREKAPGDTVTSNTLYKLFGRATKAKWMLLVSNSKTKLLSY